MDFEKNIAAYLTTLVVSGTGVALIINARLSLNTVVVVLLGILIINTILFALSE